MPFMVLNDANAFKEYKTHFRLHEEGSAAKVRDGASCHYCQIQSFSTHTRARIAIKNLVDGDDLSPFFRFIESSQLGSGVERADEAFHSGCTCVSAEQCHAGTCSCLEDALDEDELAGSGSAYDEKGCLRDEMLDSRRPIYECHEACACGEDCVNRVVQKGRTLPLDVFKTGDGRGWGVRSPYKIRRGQFIDKYVGEIITSQEANLRRQRSDHANRKDVYLFALDKFSAPDSHDPRLSGPSLEVDGEYFSGPTRFVNHSCEPNLRIFAVVGDHADKHIHDLAFFATRDIEAEEELTFDYVDGAEDDRFETEVSMMSGDMVRCLCGAKRCRGFLW